MEISREELKEVFDLSDLNKDGRISMEEFMVGIHLHTSENFMRLKSALIAGDIDGDRQITFEEFYQHCQDIS